MTPLLTPHTVAAFLAVSIDTLNAIVARGDLPFVEVGAGDKRPRRRFDPADIEAYVGERKCRSGNGRDKTHGPMTSQSGVTDIQEILAQRRSAKQNGRKPALGKTPGRKRANKQVAQQQD
ncbi:MAG: helix-turn-helix domain-containing protein [Hoeflea sp.]|uniref:helix-turn-helix domain-containing protein n=1 Tax=Hoeflea sp. TaxID=1940281 RepID=UPI003EFA8810